MISSKINKSIKYTEKRDIYPKDIGRSSSIYEIETNFGNIQIVVGNVRDDKPNILYFPIYLIYEKDNELSIHSQIGLFEINKKDSSNIIDEDGDLALDYLDEPLLYSFVNSNYIHSLSIKSDKINESDKKAVDEKSDKDFKLKLDKDQPEEKMKINEKLKNGIFHINRKVIIPPYLEEENERMADELREQYVETKKDKWINKMMKNTNYNIIEVENNGDCLFATIRDAYAQIGKITDVPTLRAIVANELTERIFKDRLELFQMLRSEKNELSKELNKLKRTIKDAETILKKDKNTHLIKETNKNIKEYNQLISKNKFNNEIYKEFDYMENINTIGDFRNYIMTSNFWADAWVISTLELILKMKMIIFGEEEFNAGSRDAVLKCGETPENLTNFNPEFYIMTSYSGNHYRLISYKEKRILKFVEIPFDVKILIIKKCMEKNSGAYDLIQDFRDLKSKILNLPYDEEIEDEQYVGGGTGLYNSNIEFIFYDKSNHTRPGKGIKEKLPKNNISDYALLSQIKDWRKKLDDSWQEDAGLFKLDNRRWKSVEHYLLGARFKKLNPDIYLLFSLDSDTDISKDLVKARNAYTDKTPDPDYNTNNNKSRRNQERLLALEAKFKQNENFKQLLLLTEPALLKQFISENPPKIDFQLMEIRKQLK